MKISAIQTQGLTIANYNNKQTRKSPNISMSQQVVNTPSFKGKKGTLLGVLFGAATGAAVIILSGGLAILGTGLTALGIGGYGLAGGLVGNSAEEETNKDKPENKNNQA